MDDSRLWIERVERLRSERILFIEESFVVFVKIKSERLSGAVIGLVVFSLEDRFFSSWNNDFIRVYCSRKQYLRSMVSNMRSSICI